jgi:hypothetical protein
VTGFLDKYNLRPNEKRLVVGVAFFFFVILNIWFVWPEFKDWGQLQERLRQTHIKLATARKEIERSKGPGGYGDKLKELEKQSAPVLPEGPDIELRRSFDSILNKSGLIPTTVSAVADSSDTTPSKFFVEKSLTMGFINTEEKTLVNFLYNLGAGSSMFRVKDLSIKPASGNYRLEGHVTIIASYLRDPSKLGAGPSTNKVSPSRTAPAKNAPAKPGKPALTPLKHGPGATNNPARRTPGAPGKPGAPDNHATGPKPNLPPNRGGPPQTRTNANFNRHGFPPAQHPNPSNKPATQ